MKRHVKQPSPRLGRWRIPEFLESRTLLTTFYVDAAAPGANTGESWPNAFASLQNALAIAVSGNTILVAQGTYKPTSGTDRTLSFNLVNGVRMYGGYAGAASNNPDSRDWVAYRTVLSGNIGNEDSAIDNSYSVVKATGTNSTTLLDGILISDGYADQSTNSGGGLYLSSSSPTLAHCEFSGNTSYNGGALYCNNSSPVLNNCVFIWNTACNHGGAVYNASSLIFNDCTFFENLAACHGGALYNQSSSTTSLTHCAFTGNFSESGAGIYNDNSSTMTLSQCDFNANSSMEIGGAIYNCSSSLSINLCSFNGNASASGGAIYYEYCSPTITNSLFSGNTACSGGAIYNYKSNSALVNCTFGENTAYGSSCIYNYDSSPSLINCIIWGSSNSIYNKYNSNPTVAYSDIKGGYAGTGNIDADPLFVRYPSPGPDEQWGTPDDDCGDLRLKTASPCINKGLNSANSTPTDLDGNPRVINSIIDMGAYEKLHKTLYVDLQAPGDNSGVSWTNAFTNLQSALLAAYEGDTIKIADGTYLPTSGTDRTVSFNLVNCAKIQGGYAGYGATNPDARDPSFYPTILSGDIGAPGDQTDNSYHVLTASSLDSETLLDGVTITLGNAHGAGTHQDNGGGMLIDSGSPTLSNCSFVGNKAQIGGGISILSSSPTLSHCSFTNNKTSTYGGGIHNLSSSPILSDCTFSSNLALSGGGLYNETSSPSLTLCSFIRNNANNGGGIYNYSHSSPVLNQCLLAGNAGAAGGGIYTLASCSVTLNNCAFTGNTAFEFQAGGMYIESSSSNLTNCSFIANSAPSSDNSSNFLGAGIYSISSTSLLTNCILWNNGVTPVFSTSSSIAINFSDIEGGYTGTDNLNADPCLLRSPWVGPDGAWGTLDDDYGDLRLRSNSPCLDSGLNFMNSTPADIAGNTRIQNSVIDMGAYEGSFVIPAPKTLYVDLNAPGNRSGSSWTNAFTALQPAINAASDGDVIKIADGTYKPATTTDRTLSFSLRNGISIFGNYAGHGAADPDARNGALYPTILSGDIGTEGSIDDNSYHVLIAAFVSSSTQLDGIAITLGNANGNALNQSNGGGLFCLAASPTLSNCAFSGNKASDGGGIYNYYYSSPNLNNCTFTRNSANSGGGINNYYYSSPNLINCTFSGNSAYYGGGIYNRNYSSPNLTNCTLSGNKSSSYGGGIFNYVYSSPNLINCTFSGNSASYGGGIYNSYYSSPKLINCTLFRNSSSHGGGIYNDYHSSPTITYSNIEGGYSGTGNINADPLFIRNPSPGADNTWGTTDDDYGDLRLQPASPCVNTGLNSANTLSTDLAGNPRVINSIIDMGDYENNFASYTASAGNDALTLTSLPDGSLTLANSSGTLIAAYSTLYTHLTLNLGAGTDSLLINLSAGQSIPFSLSNVENIQFLSDPNASMSLTPSQINIQSTTIAYSGSPAFTLLNSSLNSLTLTGNISLQLANPNLIINTGNPQTLRQYLHNASAGAQPSLSCATTPTLALLDNSRLHLTSFAGASLASPFSQLLIQSALPADANLDGTVDKEDLLDVYANLNKTNSTWLDGDVNQDGTVNLADLALVQSKLTAPSSLVLQKVQIKAKTPSPKITPKHKPRHKPARKA